MYHRALSDRDTVARGHLNIASILTRDKHITAVYRNRAISAARKAHRAAHHLDVISPTIHQHHATKRSHIACDRCIDNDSSARCAHITRDRLIDIKRTASD